MPVAFKNFKKFKSMFFIKPVAVVKGE
jgi:hypothetical protein